MAIHVPSFISWWRFEGYFWQETNIPCLAVTAKLLLLMPMFQCFNVWIYQTEPECTHSRAESTALVITVGICLPIIAVVIQVIVGSRRISWITIRLSRLQAQQCILCLTTGGPLLKHLCSPLITLYTILTIRNLLVHAKWVQCTPGADVAWAIIFKAIRRQLKNSSNRRALEMPMFFCTDPGFTGGGTHILDRGRSSE